MKEHILDEINEIIITTASKDGYETTGRMTQIFIERNSSHSNIFGIVLIWLCAHIKAFQLYYNKLVGQRTWAFILMRNKAANEHPSQTITTNTHNIIIAATGTAKAAAPTTPMKQTREKNLQVSSDWNVLIWKVLWLYISFLILWLYGFDAILISLVGWFIIHYFFGPFRSSQYGL